MPEEGPEGRDEGKGKPGEGEDTTGAEEVTPEEKGKIEGAEEDKGTEETPEETPGTPERGQDTSQWGPPKDWRHPQSNVEQKARNPNSEKVQGLNRYSEIGRSLANLQQKIQQRQYPGLMRPRGRLARVQRDT